MMRQMPQVPGITKEIPGMGYSYLSLLYASASAPESQFLTALL